MLKIRTLIVLASVFYSEKNGKPFLSKFLIGIELTRRTIRSVRKLVQDNITEFLLSKNKIRN